MAKTCTSDTPGKAKVARVRILSTHWFRGFLLYCVADWGFSCCIRQDPDDPNCHQNLLRMSLRIMSRFVSINRM